MKKKIISHFTNLLTAIAGVLFVFYILLINYDIRCESTDTQIKNTAYECSITSEPIIREDIPTKPAPIQEKKGPAIEGPAIRDPNMTWVNDTLASMTLEQKIGQMIMPWGYTSDYPTNVNQINNYYVGGFIYSKNDGDDVRLATNYLQTVSPIPLWFAADFEAGTGTRIYDATTFPMNMGMGAADDEELSELCGEITAKEAYCIGIHVGFGPVVDVNTEPINPIISTRSYSDDPDRVQRLAHAFITGAHKAGMLCTLKHYPGHGATTGDSHAMLPTVDLPRDVLEAVHIKPYSDLIPSGDVDLVMTAHVWYSALDPGDPWPATLSTVAINDILLTDLNFQGVVFSDAFNMAGLLNAAPLEEAVVIGVQAGLDVILAPASLDVGVAYNSLLSAVNNEDISVERINTSVRKILIAKSRVGLPEDLSRDYDDMVNTLQAPEHLATARTAAEESVTMIKETEGILPLTTSDKVLCLVFQYTKSGLYYNTYTNFTDILENALGTTNFESRYVSKSISSSQISQIVNDATNNFDKVVIGAYDWIKIESSNQLDLLNQLINCPTPIIYVSFGSPYHFMQCKKADIFMCAYCSAVPSQNVAAEILLGQFEPQGKLPVTIPGWPAFTEVWEFYQ